MLAQVEVSTRVNAFYFLESERHQEFDVGSSICVVSQFLVIVVTVMIIAETKSLVPFQTDFFPFLEPIEFSTRFYEELHFHLFELAHTEDELTSYDFVTECLTNLSDAERNFHTACLLNVKVVYENTLSCFRTKVYFHCAIGCRTHFGREHKVELTNFSPVLSARDRTNNFIVKDNLTKFSQIVSVHCF